MAFEGVREIAHRAAWRRMSGVLFLSCVAQDVRYDECAVENGRPSSRVAQRNQLVAQSKLRLIDEVTLASERVARRHGPGALSTRCGVDEAPMPRET
eukprot:scaffold157160_cov31-Tisochrysis_lutea.AAC.1